MPDDIQAVPPGLPAHARFTEVNRTRDDSLRGYRAILAIIITLAASFAIAAVFLGLALAAIP
jgi:hypothetical protein